MSFACRLFAVGAEADADRIDLLLKELDGKDINEIIAAGREKFASVGGGGGGGGGVVVAAAGGGGGGAAEAKEEEKKPEKEEEKEESDEVSFLYTRSFCILRPAIKCCLFVTRQPLFFTISLGSFSHFGHYHRHFRL